MLENAWHNRPGLVIVYGRRRIGKTRLIWEWLRRTSVPHVYYLAHLASHEYNLRRLAETASRQLGDELIARLRPQSLGDLLELLSRKGDVVIVLDEFTYWVRSSPRALSELQEFIDSKLSETKLLVIISGSLVGVMENSVLGGGAPLYGRATIRLKLKPLQYKHVAPIVKRMSSEDRVRLYALVGGIPYYLCLVRNTKTIDEAIEKLITSPGAPIPTEKELLLREELRDPHTYSAVLSALAKGYDTPAKIAQVTGLDPSHTSKYLYVLEHLGIVEKETPLFKKRGRYRIRDPVLRTWYTLVEPVAELLEVEAYTEAHKHVMSQLDIYTAHAWEEIVKNYLLDKLAPQGFTVVGRLEHKGEEIDIALLNPPARKAVLAEAKWSILTLAEAEKIRRETEKKAARLLPREYHVEEVIIAARSIEDIREHPQWLITPRTIEKD